MQGMSDIMALYSEGASSLCVNGSVEMLGRLAEMCIRDRSTDVNINSKKLIIVVFQV